MLAVYCQIAVLGVLAGHAGAQSSWALPQKPWLEIRQYADTLQLARPIGAAVLRDESVIVADEGLLAVMRFSRDGKPLSSFGRRGSGPREFQTMVWMGECERGRYFVRDASQARIAVVDSLGNFVTTMSGTYVGEPVASPYHSTCAPSGLLAFVAWPKQRPPAEPGPHRGTAVVAASRARGARQFSLGEFAGPERYRHSRSDGPRPLGNTLEIAVSGRNVFVGSTDSLSIAVFDDTGRRVGTIRRSGAARPLTKALIAAFIEDATAHLVDPGRRLQARAGYEALKYPSMAPAFSRLLADDVGRLWIEEFAFSVDVVKRLWCYGVEGQLVGTLTIPAAFHPFDITRRHIVGRWTDDDGSESIRAYRWLGM